MRLAAFRVMLLSLLRDPAALAMSFALPAIVYIVFAAIFAGATGGEITIRLAVVDERNDAASQRLVTAVVADPRIVRVERPVLAQSALRSLVASGEVDAGLLIARSGRALDDLDGAAPSSIEIIGDPAREISVSILQGIVQRAYFSAVPEAAVRSIAVRIDRDVAPLTPEQKVRLDAALESMRKAAEPAKGGGVRLDRVVERRNAVAASGQPIAVTYYAAAVAIMFMLFSALSGAMSLIEERESRLLDRLAASPGGLGVVIDGKFLFLVLLGVAQVTIIYAAAWLGFRVPWPAHILPWALTTICAAMAAGGLALAFVSFCRSRQQAQTLGQMLVLIVSAVGGSMVPRFLMPGYVQAAGWVTPNTWVLEAYATIFTRQGGAGELVFPWVVLAATGIVGLLVARISCRYL